MIAIEFPQVNLRIAEHQEEYETLPVFLDTDNPDHPVTMCFQLNKEEIEEVVKTGKFWFTQMTFGTHFQPIMMTTESPFK